MADKIMRGITLLLLMLSICLNVLFIGTIFVIYQDMEKKMIYDLDRVRMQYEKDVKAYYTDGCLHGSEYPEEEKLKTKQGWYENSPVFWCENSLKEKQEYIDEAIFNLGKKGLYD